ncbi:GHKL domain-containing protein, partial [bacterium]|nr:GHKL domain-containing protein [bacterium]
ARYAEPLWTPPQELSAIETSIKDIAEDENGTYWIGTDDHLISYNVSKTEFFEIDPDLFTYVRQTGNITILPNQKIAVQFDTAKESNVYIFHPAARKFTPLRHPKERIINESFPAQNQQLLIITRDGEEENVEQMNQVKSYIEIFDGQTFQTVDTLDRYIEAVGHNQAWGAMQTGNGDIWLGHFHRTPVVYKNSKEVVVHDTFPGSGCLVLLATKGNKVWVGGRNDISEFDGQQWKLVKEQTDDVEDMLEDRNGKIWVATINGVYCHNPSLPNSWIHYTVKDGLPTNMTTTLFEDSQGVIWLGTTNGICRFHPDNDPYPPIVWMEKTQNSDIIAPSGNAQFLFKGMDKWKQTHQESLLYSYRMDDRPWSEFKTQTVATFENLKPGKHTFHVRAMDLNWNISQTPATWHFTVLLPWYREPVFILSLTVSLLLTFLFAAYAINRHFRLIKNYAILRDTQTQLIQSEKMASLGQLVAGVAHEINNPINFISSNIQPLKEYLTGYKKIAEALFSIKTANLDELKEQIQIIREEYDLDFAEEDANKLIASFEDGSGRIAKIVADLRLYSRADQDYFSHFQLHESIDSSLTILYNRYKDRIEIQKDYGEIPTVKCSPSKINQVFMNLISNAIDAIESGGNIWLATKQEKNYIIITIRDDGNGIPKDIQSKIFDPFFTTKPVGSGTGLGLSIVHGIIEQHGGTITVESEVGKGTTFTVKLPIKKDEK